MTEYAPAKTGEYLVIFPICVLRKISEGLNKHNSPHLALKICMPGYLSLDIISSSELTVFLKLRSWKSFHFSEQIMSADEYPSIFSCQMDTIVFL